MKAQDLKHYGQGSTTADREFTSQNEKLKERGISNSGGQQSFQTSNKNTTHKVGRRKPLL